MSGHDERNEEEESLVRATRERRVAEEWALVLTADGLAPVIRHSSGSFAVCVQTSDAVAAAESLASYDRENPNYQPQPPMEVERIGDVDQIVAAAAAAALLCFFAVTGPASRTVSWFAAGTADASRILAGEFWLTVTALTLHADIGHVIANALFGGLFLAAVCAGFGPGLGLALTILAGACGNLLNAVFQGPEHLSIGASTAVFGAVGLLAGRGLAQRIRLGGHSLRAWVPIAAGLALIAMLGTSAKTDVWAHLFGFVAGGPIAILATLAVPRTLGPLGQLVLGLAAMAAVVLCWEHALR
jgi:rhomboid protease GluP